MFFIAGREINIFKLNKLLRTNSDINKLDVVKIVATVAASVLIAVFFSHFSERKKLLQSCKSCQLYSISIDALTTSQL